MFQSLFKRAEVAIEKSIGQMLVRALVAVPFILAVGFAMVALWIRLERAYDPETAALIMGGVFLGLGVIGAIALAASRPPSAGSDQERAHETGADKSASAQPAAPLSDSDKELLQAALGTVAPIALPHVLRVIMRNLPLIAAVAAAAFVATRSTAVEEPTAAPQPAE